MIFCIFIRLQYENFENLKFEQQELLSKKYCVSFNCKLYLNSMKHLILSKMTVEDR